MKKTVKNIRAAKNRAEPLVCLTAYTTPMAQIMDDYVDVILVGDSVGMALYGYPDTLNVTVPMMIAHGQAVMRGTKQALVVVDMPYGSYEDSDETALKNAKLIMNETGCDAVKLEGGTDMSSRIEILVQNNIPVMAHIGLQPQSVRKENGYKIKGKNNEEIEKLHRDAKAVENAGAFACVIEGTINDVAQSLTQNMTIPTIGIGASGTCDGQILVSDDMIGLTQGHVPKFVKQYSNLSAQIQEAIESYANDVRNKKFPGDDYIYRKQG